MYFCVNTVNVLTIVNIKGLYLGLRIFGGSLYLFIYLFIIIFWPRRVACRISDPRPGFEPVPPALGAQSLKHWAAREVPGGSL